MSGQQNVPPWQVSYVHYCIDLSLQLGRALTAGEKQRARNGYSHRISPSALATLIRSGRQH